MIGAGPLASRDFRVLWLSSVLASIGFRGQVVVLGWLVLDLTDSALAVGIGIGVLMAPNAIFGLLGGAIVDRFDRRRVIGMSSAAIALNTCFLGAIATADAGLAPLLALTFVSGTIWSIQQTARQSYAFDIVGDGLAVRALSMTSLAQRIGGVAGGLGAGLLLERLGAGEAYLGAGVCLGAAAVAIALARGEGNSAPGERHAVLANLREYAAELKVNRTLATLIVLTAGVEVLGFSHMSALPLLARDVLGDDDGGTLGLLTAVSSVGGVLGIAVFSAGGDKLPRGRAFLGVLVVFGVALILLGGSSSLLPATGALLAVSAMAALSDVLSQSLVQLSVRNEMRGRAMGSWMLAIGMAPIGHLQIGALATAVGVSTALAANGGALLCLAAVAAVLVPRIRRL